MTKRLTCHRDSPTSSVMVPIMIFNPHSEFGVPISAQLDTGCDHTCIRSDVLAEIGIEGKSSFIEVKGIGGTSSARTAYITIGIKGDDGVTFIIQEHQVAVLPGISEKILLGRELLAHLDVDIRRTGEVSITWG